MKRGDRVWVRNHYTIPNVIRKATIVDVFDSFTIAVRFDNYKYQFVPRFIDGLDHHTYDISYLTLMCEGLGNKIWIELNNS